jgi:RNA polymerase sigma-70 factor (ECF subfamily)
LARRLSPNPSDAEDAVQEIFIDLWRSAERYDPSAGTETAFVSTIARRRLIDRHRRRSRRIGTVPLTSGSAFPTAEKANLVDARDEADRAREKMGRLRPDERRILELSVYEGLSHREIAEATDLPLGTVKTHARRGLARLRRLLGAEADGEDS